MCCCECTYERLILLAPLSCVMFFEPEGAVCCRSINQASYSGAEI